MSAVVLSPPPAVQARGLWLSQTVAMSKRSDHRHRPPTGPGHPVSDLPAVLCGARHVVVRSGGAACRTSRRSTTSSTSRWPAPSSKACCSAVSPAVPRWQPTSRRASSIACWPRRHRGSASSSGRLAGAALFGGFQAIVFVLLLLPFGVSIKAGVAGFIVIVLCGATDRYGDRWLHCGDGTEDRIV